MLRTALSILDQKNGWLTAFMSLSRHKVATENHHVSAARTIALFIANHFTGGKRSSISALAWANICWVRPSLNLITTEAASSQPTKTRN